MEPREVDEYGIEKLYSDGPFKMHLILQKGRQDGKSNRWSADPPSPKENIHYEITAYIKVKKKFDGFNIKFWGPHHGKRGIAFDNIRNKDGKKTPCCWYDIGIYADGSVAPQIEFPHNDNYDMTYPNLKKIGIGSIVNKWIGAKWIVFKVGTRRKVELWYDPGGLDNDDNPANQWERLINKVDNGDWLRADYSPPDQQEIELRIRDTNPENIQINYAYARDITPPARISQQRIRAKTRRIIHRKKVH